MERGEQIHKWNQILERTRHFENLQANDDFIKWRDGSIIPHLESIRDSILTVDKSQDGWRDRVAEAVVAYQEVQRTYDKLFTLNLKTAQHARSELAKLAEAPE